MRVIPTAIPDVLIIEPNVHTDERGFFLETYHEKRYREMGIDVTFVQDNFAYSKKNVLRGLHYQLPNDQAKLIYVIRGEIFDVAVDIRKDSPTFGKWVGETLSGLNKKQFFLPVGFAHGYCVLSEATLVVYKCSMHYSAADEKGILWNDPDLNISWPIEAPLLSQKDIKNPCVRDKPEKHFPRYVVD